MTIFVIGLAVLVIVLGAMVARLQSRLDGIDFRTASTDNDVAGQHYRIVKQSEWLAQLDQRVQALEAAERARKELPK